MQLDWSTLFLEILNFLVLVWLLKRFLYRPIMSVVAARQMQIEQATQRTRAAEAKAHALEVEYNARVQSWEQERAKAREALQQELQAQRQRAMARLDSELEQQRRKAEVLEHRREHEQALRAQQQAIVQAHSFLRRLLTALSGPELQSKLVRLAIDQLAHEPQAPALNLRQALSGTRDKVIVSSAYPLPSEQREALSKALGQALVGEHEWIFREDPSLIAGVRIELGSWALHANLSEELTLFTEAAR